MSCAACGRAPQGFLYRPPGQLDQRPQRACSMRCLNILCHRRGHVITLQHYEELGITAASDAGGAFLEQIGKTDLAQLTAEEWRDFVATVFIAATERVRVAVEQEEVPF